MVVTWYDDCVQMRSRVILTIATWLARPSSSNASTDTYLEAKQGDKETMTSHFLSHFGHCVKINVFPGAFLNNWKLTDRQETHLNKCLESTYDAAHTS